MVETFFEGKEGHKEVNIDLLILYCHQKEARVDAHTVYHMGCNMILDFEEMDIFVDDERVHVRLDQEDFEDALHRVMRELSLAQSPHPEAPRGMI
jgi:NADH/NAD ratio-sensing transcriptional regulator Rex